MRLRPAASLAVLAALATAAPAQAIGTEELRSTLLREARQAGAFSGAYARDLASGTELVSLRPDTPRIPASVTKLFVTAAALLRYGPAQKLTTRVVTSAPVDAEGRLEGSLYLVGGGDPALDEADLRRLARTVRATGIRRVTGGVVGDEGRFDARRGGPRTRYRADGDIGGRLGGLVLGRGFRPSPATYAAQRLARRLRLAGVQVLARSRAGRAPDGAAEVAVDPSLPMRELVRRTNVTSDNFLAEMLLKNLGASFGDAGSTVGGARVVRAVLDDFGVRPRVTDGSGLSRSNRTTPRQVVRLVERMEGQDIASSWRSSLAVAGRTGTVRRRMQGTAAQDRCRVKTGTIRGVSNLAGICTTTGGRAVAFAWLMNGVSPFGARRIQDRMTAALARYAPSAEPSSPGGAPAG